MYWIRWVRGTDAGKAAQLRDEEFPTKNDALRRIGSVKVATISKITENKGRVYIVTEKKS